MSTNHNRIKVADLEKNQPNKILKTNQNGELEFSDATNLQTETYNELDCITEGKALDARQGKVLKEMIDNINELTVLSKEYIPNISCGTENGIREVKVVSAYYSIIGKTVTVNFRLEIVQDTSYIRRSFNISLPKSTIKKDTVIVSGNLLFLAGNGSIAALTGNYIDTKTVRIQFVNPIWWDTDNLCILDGFISYLLA